MTRNLSRRKAQINIEFLAAALIYLAALAGLMTIGSGAVPSLSGEVEKSSLNLEARQISTQLLTTPGRQSFTPGSNWERNNTTVEHTTSIGLASGHHNVERDKIGRLRTSNPVRNDFNFFNYSQFKQVTGADNQYRFEFRWKPMIETHRNFRRGDAPFAAKDGKPNITEPGTDYYSRSRNRVHYGSAILHGRDYHFLVTSHDGKYNTTYVSRDWDFQTSQLKGIDDSFSLYGEDFTVENIQNRARTPGALVILDQHLKTFGASADSDSEVIRMERYGIMENEPLEVIVLAW